MNSGECFSLEEKIESDGHSS
jgi:hypothetical protein